jgi:hypothetical protein
MGSVATEGIAPGSSCIGAEILIKIRQKTGTKHQISLQDFVQRLNPTGQPEQWQGWRHGQQRHTFAQRSYDSFPSRFFTMS